LESRLRSKSARRSKPIAASYLSPPRQNKVGLMTRIGALALIAGLIGAVGLVFAFGIGDIAAAVASFGWLGFVIFCFAHAPVAILLGLSWRALLPQRSCVGSTGVIAARVLRDAGAEVLPFSEIGGFVIGARAAMLAGLSGAEAAASTLVDLTTEALAQLAFIALGLFALRGIQPDAAILRPATIGLIVVAAVILVAGVVLRNSRRLALKARAGARRWLAVFGEVNRALLSLRQMLDSPKALAISFALHLAAWVGVALEAWFALRLMGAPISLPAAMALESLLFAARSLAFFTPSALGVQEGAYAALAPLVGLAPSDALALSLIKRARDLAIGAPALLIWERIEAARLLRTRSAADPYGDEVA
jgi:putative membrane protein